MYAVESRMGLYLENQQEEYEKKKFSNLFKVKINSQSSFLLSIALFIFSFTIDHKVAHSEVTETQGNIFIPCKTE